MTASPFVLPRIYPILDIASLERHGVGVHEAAAALLEGGARILQFRQKGFWSRETVRDARGIAALCAEAGIRFIINDRADYAALIGLDFPAGLHVGQEDLTPSEARRIVGAGAVLGFSTHNAEQMRAAEQEPVDYLAFGPVFPTVSKARPDPTVGLAGLRAVRKLTDKPLVAIGGVTLRNASACFEAGADAVAVIGGLLPEAGDSRTVGRSLRERMREWAAMEAGPRV